MSHNPSKINEDLNRAVELVRSGELDQAHRLAQVHEGDYIADSIHAVIHRREGDFSNSLYWWRRVGSKLPVELASVYPEPASFVADCRDTPDDPTVLHMQEAELDALQAAVAHRANG